MAMQRSRPHYTVRVDRHMVGDSRFVIQAALEYRPELSDTQRARVTPMAQLELLLAIQGEEARGRLLGAEAVRVEVAGDAPLRRFFEGRSGKLPVPKAITKPGRSTWGAFGGIAARAAQEL